MLPYPYPSSYPNTIIAFQVYQFARRGLLDRHKLILATQLVLQVLRKASPYPYP